MPKNYCARYLHYDDNKQLVEARKEFMAQSNKDAKITARNIAQQNDWRLLMLFTGSFSIPGTYIIQ